MLAAYWWDCLSQNYAHEMRKLDTDPEEKKKALAQAQRKVTEDGFRHFSQRKK